MKCLKQATYIRYVIAKLSKFIEIEIQSSSDFVEFFDKLLFCNITQTGQISLPD